MLIGVPRIYKLGKCQSLPPETFEGVGIDPQASPVAKKSLDSFVVIQFRNSGDKQLKTIFISVFDDLITSTDFVPQ